MVVLSTNYFDGEYTKVELDAALARQQSQPDYILPVRSDMSAVPDALKQLAYLELDDGIESIADRVANKLREVGALDFIPSDLVPSPNAASEYPTEVVGFDRSYFDELKTVTNRNLVARCWELSPHADAVQRAALAEDLVREIGYRLHLVLGPPYTAWRADERTVFLSALPSIAFLPQTTVELRLYVDRIVLSAKWSATDDVWNPIPPEAFAEHLDGLMADRHGCNMDRETALKVVADRGAIFDFPAGPPGQSIEPMCQWRIEMPRDIAFDLDRNPLLVGPQVAFFGTVHYKPTLTGMAIYRVQGTWSNEALHELHDAFEILLPRRHVIRSIRYGVRRISIYLCRVRGVHSSWETIRELTDTADVDRAMQLSAAALARMVAKERHVPLEPARSSGALHEPPDWAYADFLNAEEELDGREYPAPVDSASVVEAHQADWTKLRQSTEIDVESTAFRFEDVISNDELVRYVLEREAI